MKTLQLFKQGKEILGSDGIMYVDGRLNATNIRLEIVKRNERYAKNFPHRLADSYAIYHSRIGGSMSTIKTL
jgi:hypothetical protein